MAGTLVLYEGKLSSTERVARAVAYMIGNVRVREISESTEDPSDYDGVCLVFNFYGALTAGKSKSFLLRNAEILAGKRVACVGIGFSDQGFAKYIVDADEALGGRQQVLSMFVRNENQIAEAGYQIAKKMRSPLSPMPENELTAEIASYASSHSLLALATGSDRYIRCTPLPYVFHDGFYYVMTKGGYKFRGILENDHVSAAVFDTAEGENGVSLRFFGKAEVVPEQEGELAYALENAGEPPFADGRYDRFVLKLTPLKYEYRQPAFAARGYDAVQVMNTEFRRQDWETSAAQLPYAAERQEEIRRAMSAQMADARSRQQELYREKKLSVDTPDKEGRVRFVMSSDIDRMLAEAEDLELASGSPDASGGYGAVSVEESAADDGVQDDGLNWYDYLPEEPEEEEKYEQAELDLSALQANLERRSDRMEEDLRSGHFYEESPYAGQDDAGLPVPTGFSAENGYRILPVDDRDDLFWEDDEEEEEF